MHKALREVLGAHVQQRGSMVNGDRTRFDFVHTSPMTREQINEVEDIVNKEILEPLFFIGIILLACSPGGSSSNIFSMIAKGDVALSVSLTACRSIITLFTIPVIMEFATHFVDSNLDIDIHLSLIHIFL